MSVNTGEIQPVGNEQWVAPDLNRKEAHVVAPIAKSEGGAAAKLEDNKTNYNPSSGASSEGQTQGQNELPKELQDFLNETFNIRLEYKKGSDGKMIVQVLDSTTGDVIRQIPPENFDKISKKLEELRGIIFDGKA